MDERCERGDHLWNVCTCKRCGETDVDRHEFPPDSCVCIWCGDELCDWDPLVCSRCGKEQTLQETVACLTLDFTLILTGLGATIQLLDCMARCPHCSESEAAPDQEPPDLEACDRLYDQIEMGQAALLNVHVIAWELTRRDEESEEDETVRLQRRLSLYHDVAQTVREMYLDRMAPFLEDSDPSVRDLVSRLQDCIEDIVLEAFSRADETELNPEEAFYGLIARYLPIILRNKSGRS